MSVPPTSATDPNIQLEIAANNNPSKNSELMAKIKRVAGVILAVLGAVLLCAGIATFFLPLVTVAIAGHALVTVATSLLACGFVFVSVGSYLAASEDPIANSDVDLEVSEAP